jgi:uracil-DNA glycosylase
MSTSDATGPDAAIVALLEWYADQGVDLAVDDTPHNRFVAPPVDPVAAAAPEGPRLVPRAQEQPVAERPAIMPADEAVHAARSQASGAQTLDDLRRLLERFDGCGLKQTANRLVFADGMPGARVMLVGEAPGADEDREGFPFVGRSGKLLDKMLAAIGLDRSTVYIANIVPWRPPGNRTPTPQETAICLPFIRRQIELASPDVLVCLGGPASQTLLEQREGIMKMRGNWFDFRCDNRTIRALPTLHPAYILRQPLHKRLAWRDMLQIKDALGKAPA